MKITSRIKITEVLWAALSVLSEQQLADNSGLSSDEITALAVKKGYLSQEIPIYKLCQAMNQALNYDVRKNGNQSFFVKPKYGKFNLRYSHPTPLLPKATVYKQDQVLFIEILELISSSIRDKIEELKQAS